MGKFILLSIIISSIVIPARNARAKDPRAGLKKTQKEYIIACALYLFALMYLYGRTH